MEAEKYLRIFPQSQVENVHWYGRNGAENGERAIFWTAGGFAVLSSAREIWAEIEADYEEQAPWAIVFVNGAAVSRFCLEKGKRWYLIFRGNGGEKPCKIELLKDTQAMPNDNLHCFLIHSLGVPRSFSGEPFLRLPDFISKIEFIGDSITTGEGLAGSPIEDVWGSAWISLRDNYALLTSRAMNADFRFLSQSGWGVLAGWDNDRTTVLPPHYESVCSVMNGARQVKMGAKNANDFASWKPDFVVVNLGTNDVGAFNSPAKIASDGTVQKLRLDADGKPNADDLSLFLGAVKDFLSKIRRNNPASHIVWAYGMCSFSLGEEIAGAVRDFARETLDNRVSFVRLPSMAEESEDEKGALNHPSAATHKRAAKVLIAHLKSLE